MLQYETICPNTLDLLKKIQSLDFAKDLRLVGGTALALQIGHRISVDLDLFGNTSASLEEIAYELSSVSSVSPLSSSKMMRFLIVDGVKVDIVSYPYPWLDVPVVENGIVLAGIRDIAAMKLSVITNRGTKKDFIDYYFLLKSYSLGEMFDIYFDIYIEKYSDAQLFSAIKSLTYFEDAESDPMPRMLKEVDWGEVKKFIINAVNEYLKY